MKTEKVKDPKRDGSDEARASVTPAKPSPTALSGVGKWTPRPWRVVEPDESGEERFGVAAVDDGPGWVYIVEQTGQDNEADAHLIAAAPELYAALEAATNALELALWQMLKTFPDADGGLAQEISEHVVVKPARAALAKARGETDAG